MRAVSQAMSFNLCVCLGLSLQAAMCYIHIAALIAEYLKRKGKAKIFKTNYVSLNSTAESHFWLPSFPYVYNILKAAWSLPKYFVIKIDGKKPVLALEESKCVFSVKRVDEMLAELVLEENASLVCRYSICMY